MSLSRRNDLETTRFLAEAAFMRGVGIAPGALDGFVTLPTSDFYIDPINGNDNNSGFSPSKALKTYKQLQQRFGRFTTLVLPLPKPTPTYFNVAISNLAPGPNGQIVVTIASPETQLVTGMWVNVSSIDAPPDDFPPIVGTNEALGNWQITVINSTTFILNGSLFQNAYGGGGSVNAPISQIVTIHLIGNLPTNDPITFYNFVGVNTLVVVLGEATILHSGTITAVQTEDPSTNTPWTMTDSSVSSWTADLFVHQIQITSGAAGPITVPGEDVGARAWPTIDLGSGQVQVSEWCQSDPVGNFPLSNVLPATGTFYAPTPPAIGDTYRVVDFSNAVLGVCLVGYDSSLSLTQATDGFGFGGFVLQNIHLVAPPDLVPPVGGDDEVVLDGMNPLNNAAIMGYCDVCFDDLEITFNGGYTFITNPSFNSGFTFLGPAQSSGTFWAFGCAGPAQSTFESGSYTNIDGNVQFVGDGAGFDAVIYLGGFGSGGGAFINSGPLNFWNNVIGSIGLFNSSTILFNQASPLFEDTGYDPLWGVCLGSGNWVSQNSIMSIQQFVPATAAIITPTLVAGAGGYDLALGAQTIGYPFLADEGGFVPSYIQGYAFDPTTGANIAGLRAFTWSMLVEATGSGGYQQPHQSIGGSAYDAIGGAYRPDTPATCIMEVLVFPGP